MEELLRQAVWFKELPGDLAMQTPEDVHAMLKLASLGWGAKRLAGELGCSRNTVRRYLREGGWEPYRPPARGGCLDQHARWLQERFFQHRRNCDVVRQNGFIGIQALKQAPADGLTICWPATRR